MLFENFLEKFWVSGGEKREEKGRKGKKRGEKGMVSVGQSAW